VPSFDEIKDIVLFGVDLDPVIKATITDENLRRRVHEDLVRAEFESRARSTEVAPQINLGNAYLFLGKYEDALRKFDEAERISARPSEIYNGRGVALAMLGRQAEAVAAFQQALARDKDAKFHNNLGNLYLLGARDSQAVQQAVAAYDQSLKLDKLNAAAYNGRGVLALVQQAVAEAGDYFSQSLQVKDRAVAHSNLGNARLLQNDLPAARSEYDRAIQLDAADGAALNNRGVAHLRERNFPAAKADFEAAIGVIPQDATPYLGLGLAHVGLKEFGPAAAAFIKSVQLHPANRTAYRNLAFLYFTEEPVRASIESQLQETAGARADVQPAVERFLEFLRSLTAVSRESFDASFERFQLPAGAGR
jgi:tetratricopeptide (TPR) repeat protein